MHRLARVGSALFDLGRVETEQVTEHAVRTAYLLPMTLGRLPVMAAPPKLAHLIGIAADPREVQ